MKTSTIAAILAGAAALIYIAVTLKKCSSSIPGGSVLAGLIPSGGGALIAVPPVSPSLSCHGPACSVPCFPGQSSASPVSPLVSPAPDTINQSALAPDKNGQIHPTIIAAPLSQLFLCGPTNTYFSGNVSGNSYGLGNGVQLFVRSADGAAWWTNNAGTPINYVPTPADKNVLLDDGVEIGRAHV